MLVAYDADFDGDVERALLKYWGDWMRLKKRYKKHVQRVYQRNKWCQERREARVVDAEIRVLETCINQVHALRRMRSEMRAKPR